MPSALGQQLPAPMRTRDRRARAVAQSDTRCLAVVADAVEQRVLQVVGVQRGVPEAQCLTDLRPRLVPAHGAVPSDCRPDFHRRGHCEDEVARDAAVVVGTTHLGDLFDRRFGNMRVGEPRAVPPVPAVEAAEDARRDQDEDRDGGRDPQLFWAGAERARDGSEQTGHRQNQARDRPDAPPAVGAAGRCRRGIVGPHEPGPNDALRSSRPTNASSRSSGSRVR